MHTHKTITHTLVQILIDKAKEILLGFRFLSMGQWHGARMIEL